MNITSGNSFCGQIMALGDKKTYVISNKDLILVLTDKAVYFMLTKTSPG